MLYCIGIKEDPAASRAEMHSSLPDFCGGKSLQEGINIMLEKVFKLRENHTTVKTEILAGITTFMTMAYILAVNPNVLSASGMDRGAVFTATRTGFISWNCLHGIVCKLSVCIGSGYGTECIFCLYARHRYGVSMAVCAGSRFCRRCDFYSAFAV